MTSRQLRLLPEDDRPASGRDVNQWLRVALGIDGGYVLLRGFDGIRRDKNGTALASNTAPLDVQMPGAAIPGGTFLLSTFGATVTPSAANSHRILDDGLYLAAGKGVRIYASDGTDYAGLTSDVDGGLAVAGSGANAGLLTIADLLATGNLAWKSGTAFKITLDHAATADRVITVPDATDTLALLARSQTFSGTNTFSSAAPLVLTGAAARITGPFGDATRGNRPFFQSSAANGDTLVNAMPSGANTISKFEAHNNSTPGSASVVASLEANGTEARLTAASAAGAAAALHLYVGTTKAVDITTAGVVRLVGDLFVSGDTTRSAVYRRTLVVNSGATAQIHATVAGPQGFLKIQNSASYGALFVSRAADVVAHALDDATQWSVVAGTAAKTNVYKAAGVLTIQNNTAGALTYHIQIENYA